jgi:hypothetical protein
MLLRAEKLSLPPSKWRFQTKKKEDNSFTEKGDSRSLAETALENVQLQLVEYIFFRGMYPA